MAGERWLWEAAFQPCVGCSYSSPMVGIGVRSQRTDEQPQRAEWLASTVHLLLLLGVALLPLASASQSSCCCAGSGSPVMAREAAGVVQPVPEAGETTSITSSTVR